MLPKLKPVLLFIFCLCGLVTYIPASQAQIHYKIGLNISRMPFSAYNNVITHYNETRDWLDNRLETHKIMPGFSFGVYAGNAKGKGFYFMLMEIHSRWRRSTAAGTTANGEDFKRKLNSRLVQVSLFGLGYKFALDAGEKHHIGLNITLLDNGFYRLRSKYNDEKWERVNLEDGAIFLRGLALSNTFSVEYSFMKERGGIDVQLYYQPFWLGDFNFVALNKDINPATWENHYSHRLSGRPHNWGIKVLYVINRK